MGRHSKSESDVEDDVRVADSPAYRHGDGSCVERTASEEGIDARQTGTEARGQEI
jgi:hypothetical protein